MDARRAAPSSIKKTNHLEVIKKKNILCANGTETHCGPTRPHLSAPRRGRGLHESASPVNADTGPRGKEEACGLRNKDFIPPGPTAVHQSGGSKGNRYAEMLNKEQAPEWGFSRGGGPPQPKLREKTPTRPPAEEREKGPCPLRKEKILHQGSREAQEK